MSYQIHNNRSTEAAKAVLRDYSGKVVADGFGVYGSHAKKFGRYILGNCWVHTRRKFVVAEQFFPKAGEMVELIGQLYAVEAEATGPPYDSERLEHLHELWQSKSKSIVREIETWALSQRVLPKSALGKALSNMAKMWRGLQVFFDDPRVSLDSNSVERSLRGVVVGRKNHLGSKSRRGTEVSASLYSLSESAKLCDVEPRAYLKSAVIAAIEGRSVPLPHEYAGFEIG